MIYLKTYFYTPHEIKYLVANLIESHKHIDYFIVCESNIHHTGRSRDLIYERLKVIDSFPEKLREKVIYLPFDLSSSAGDGYNNEDVIHQVNEPLMRSAFSQVLNFQDNDIIFSVDADEIIYGDSYSFLIKEVKKHSCIRINFNQFFYKFNYLWKNQDFTSPIGARYSHFRQRFPANWRDEGKLVEGKHGAHLSWCMTVDEMIFKLDTYSHPRYRFCSDTKLLHSAIDNKEYPFDKSVDFKITELEWDDARIPSFLRR